MRTTSAAMTVRTMDTELDQAVDTYRVWCSVLAILREQVPEPSFRTWLEGTHLYAFDGTKTPGISTTSLASVAMATVAVPSTFAAEWLQRRYRVLITEALEICLGRRVGIQFKVEAVRSHRAISALDGIGPRDGEPQLPLAIGQSGPLSSASRSSLSSRYSRVSQTSSASRATGWLPAGTEGVNMTSDAAGVHACKNAIERQAPGTTAVQGVQNEQALQDVQEVQDLSNANQYSSLWPAPAILAPPEAPIAPATHRPLNELRRAHPLPIPALNPRHTFDRFLVERGNQLAATVAQRVAEAPGAAYNPLFLYGLRGVGKTHLLQAIGHDARARMGARALFASALQFLDDRAGSPLSSLASPATIMSYDLLLVDDLHYIAGGNGRCAQRTLEALVEGMLAAGKGVVVTATHPPDAMLAVHETLRFRLRGGMVVAIEPPDTDLRTRLVRQLATESGVLVAPGAMDMLAFAGQSMAEVHAAWDRACARSVQVADGGDGGNNQGLATDNIRAARSTLPVRAISTQDVQSALAERHTRTRIQPETIIDQVSAYFDLEVNELSSASRERRVMMPRHIAMYLIREETTETYEWIAHRFARQDHTTAMHACAKIEELMEIDLEVRQAVLELRQMVYGEHHPAYAEDLAC